MKIAWICNIQFPKVSKKLGEEVNNFGGWLVNSAELLNRKQNIDLYIMYPKKGIDAIKRVNIDGIEFIAFPKGSVKNMEMNIKSLLIDIKPDIFHIHGTEEKHSLAAVNANETNINTVLSIQGIVSMIGKYYRSDIPISIIYKHKLRDLIKNSSIIYQEKKFRKRGKLEANIIKQVKYIIGRTEWDEACVKLINNEVDYYKCNETLRHKFYKHRWEIDKCNKYTIFMSQGSYPIKGLHYLLEAMPEILKKFPETKLYISGPNIIDRSSFKAMLKESSYGEYIRKLIKKNNLEKNVFFLGILTEEEMCQRYLKSHIYICPSSIENSPNSLGEAMILGMPCIASDTGGISSLITNGYEGFLYPLNQRYMISHYINKIFSNDSLAVEMGENAYRRARDTHDEIHNSDKLVCIYEQILKNINNKKEEINVKNSFINNL